MDEALYRGNKIVYIRPDWVYMSDGKLVSSDSDRPCAHCGKENTPEGYDGCIGEIRWAMNACCGHGSLREAYCQFWSRRRISGVWARLFFRLFKKRKNGGRNDNSGRF